MYIFKLKNVSLFFLYFSRFFLTTIIGQVLILLCIRKTSMPLRIYAYIFIVFCYWLIVLSFGSTLVGPKHLLFYFSFIPPLILLFTSDERGFIELITVKFIVTICVLIIIEALLVNSSFISYMYFFPSEGSSERVQMFGFYQRPLGVAGNSSMTSVILIFSLSLRDAIKKSFSRTLYGNKAGDGIDFTANPTSFLNYPVIFVSLSIFILMSGMGFILLLLYYVLLIFEKKTLNGRNVFSLLIILLALSGLTYVWNYDFEVNKFSFDYFIYLVEFKIIDVLGEWANLNAGGYLKILFGGQIDLDAIDVLTSSDFGYLVMYKAIGLLGVLLVLATPLLFASSLIVFVRTTIFFYASFLHYPGLLSPPGTILFSLYLYLLHSYEMENKKARCKKSLQTTAIG